MTTTNEDSFNVIYGFLMRVSPKLSFVYNADVDYTKFNKNLVDFISSKRAVNLKRWTMQELLDKRVFALQCKDIYYLTQVPYLVYKLSIHDVEPSEFSLRITCTNGSFSCGLYYCKGSGFERKSDRSTSPTVTTLDDIPIELKTYYIPESDYIVKTFIFPTVIYSGTVNVCVHAIKWKGVSLVECQCELNGEVFCDCYFNALNDSITKTLVSPSFGDIMRMSFEWFIAKLSNTNWQLVSMMENTPESDNSVHTIFVKFENI